MGQKIISLSKYLSVSRSVLEKKGIFDSTLGTDTKLFVDPKLLVDSKISEFKKSREEILRYFKRLIQIHKQSHKSKRLLIAARDMLAVSEPIGLSIGYGNKSDDGTAIPKNVANRILLSISEILSVGIEDEEIVELLGLFVEGFGPDSMSDLIVHIIYPSFCSYTHRLAKELNVKTQEYKIEGKKYFLPVHPFTKEHIIFVPSGFLRELPVATSYDEIVSAAEHSAELRKQLNEIVFPSLREVLEDIASKTPIEISEFKKGMSALLEIYKKMEVKAYSLKEDRLGYYGLNPFIEKEAPNIHVRSKPSNGDQLIKSVGELIAQFRRSIEDNGGNNLLYRRTSTGALLEDKPHREDVAQKIFYMIADLFCQQANILLSGESDAGRGPVDFSLGTAYDKKVLVEIKKSTNSNIQDGYTEQVKAYQKSEHAIHSFYVVIIVKKETSRKGYDTQLEAIQKLYDDNKKKGIKTPDLVIIDGLIHPSPSKLKKEK